MKPEEQEIMIEALTTALAKMAERCVHAEARAQVAEAEVKALKGDREALKEELLGTEWEKRRLWLCMWSSKGVSLKTLVKYRVEVLNEPLEEAKRLVYSGRWSYSLGGIDGQQVVTFEFPEREPVE